MPDLTKWREDVRAEALRLGFSLVGFTSAEPLSVTIQRRWQRWLKAGRAGAMKYLLRSHPRRTHPQDLSPSAKCVIVAGVGYYDGDHPNGATGKIARYAWGKDYHFVLRDRLGDLAGWIENSAKARGYAEPLQSRIAVDSAPLDERALAERAGLGFIGKNTLLLNPRRGSWMVLGELLISIPFPSDQPVKGTCGSCRKCLEACPTQAFVGPYELDPRRCISYLTIEQRGPIPPDFAEKTEGWAFGCDICQEVCPFNAPPLPRLLPEFSAQAGFGKCVTEEALSNFKSGKAFLRRWGKTPLSRAGLKGMIRNLLAAERKS